MQLTRIYGDDGKTVVGYKLVHTGISPEQNFSERLVGEGIAAGIMTLNGNQLTVKCQNAELKYTVNRAPGYYSLQTGEQIPISTLALSQRYPVGTLAAREARAWLQAKGQTGGYEVTNAYECVLNDEQHERFRATKDQAGNLVPAEAQEI